MLVSLGEFSARSMFHKLFSDDDSLISRLWLITGLRQYTCLVAAKLMLYAIHAQVCA